MTETYDYGGNRPYAPPSNVIAVIQRLRNRNLPESVNSEYLKNTSIPDGTITRTLFSLRFLGLIDEAGEPTEALRSIASSTDEEYVEILSGLIRHAYREVFGKIDPKVDSQSKIVNFFRHYIPASQRERMVIFFLGMCREARIATQDVPRQRKSRATIARPSIFKTPQSCSCRKSKNGGPYRRVKTGLRPVEPIHPVLESLIRSLPPAGEPFPLLSRQQWLNAVEATIEFLYPETPTPTEQDNPVLSVLKNEKELVS